MDVQKQVEGALEAYGNKRIGRREFLKLLGAAGVTAGAAGQLLATAHEAHAQAVNVGGTFIEGYDRDFNPLDPLKSPWADPGMNAVYEPLVSRDMEGRIVAFLAESYESSDAQWRFTIPQGRQFHSGADLTPQSVVDAIKVMMTTGEGQNASFYTAVSSVETDGSDVVVNLSTPKQGLGEVLATEYAYIPNVARRIEVGVGTFGAREADGTGPFRLTEYTTGSRVRVEKWAEYKGSGAPYFENRGAAHLDAVEWVPILEPSQRAAEIETGSVHAVKNPSPADVGRLQSNSDLVVIEFPETSNFFLLPNARKVEFGFDDVRVRRALSHAIDREGIVRAILNGRGEATRGPVSSGWKYYEPGVTAFNQHDPDLSASLLDEAGWTVGSGGVREKDGNRLAFTAINISNPIENQVMAAISSMLEEIGVSMTVESLEGAAFRERRPQADMFGFKWLWSVPADVVPLFIGNFQPKDHPDVAPVLAHFAEWSGARSEEELTAAASKLQLSVAELSVILPVYTPTTVWVHHKRVHGWRPNPHNLYPFYNDVWIEA